MDVYEKVKLSKDEAMEIIERMPYIRTIKAPNIKIQNEIYTEALASRDCIEWIKIIKTIYIRREEKRLSEEEIQFESSAKKLLYESLSDALSIPVSKMEDFIKQYIAYNL